MEKTKMNTFITSDFHLGDDRMTIMGRPFGSGEEHIEALTKNHNSVVAPDDLVILVGDVCYQKKLESLPIIQRFNGRKILIRGNHDRGFSKEELDKYFEHVIPEGEGIELEVDGIKCFATHYPTTGMAGRFNLVGHIHSSWKYQLNMFNVGVDTNHFFPVNLKTIPFHFKAICEFYDDDVWVAYNVLNSNFCGIRGKSGTYFKTPE
jgi:calcineurin-like phosphoesterase family protein